MPGKFYKYEKSQLPYTRLWPIPVYGQQVFSHIYNSPAKQGILSQKLGRGIHFFLWYKMPTCMITCKVTHRARRATHKPIYRISMAANHAPSTHAKSPHKNRSPAATDPLGQWQRHSRIESYTPNSTQSSPYTPDISSHLAAGSCIHPCRQSFLSHPLSLHIHATAQYRYTALFSHPESRMP